MSKSVCHIDTNRAMVEAAKILSGNKAQLNRLKRARQLIDEIPGTWDSGASSQLSSLSKKMKKDIQDAETQINRHADFLNDVALTYLDSENKIFMRAHSFGK